MAIQKTSHDRHQAQLSGSDLPNTEERERELRRMQRVHSQDSVTGSTIYRTSSYMPGEEPYDGYQQTAAPSLAAALATLRGAGYLAVSGFYYLMMAGIFLLGAVYTAAGGDIVRQYIERREYSENAWFLSFGLPVLLLALAAIHLAAGLAAVVWRHNAFRSGFLILLGLAEVLLSAIWLSLVLPYFDLGMGVSVASALIYLLGAVLNQRDRRRRGLQKRA